MSQLYARLTPRLTEIATTKKIIKTINTSKLQIYVP